MQKKNFEHVKQKIIGLVLHNKHLAKKQRVRYNDRTIIFLFTSYYCIQPLGGTYARGFKYHKDRVDSKEMDIYNPAPKKKHPPYILLRICHAERNERSVTLWSQPLHTGTSPFSST